jgi:hypothetical protein
MIAILEDKPRSWGMGGRGTRHRGERMSTLPLIVRRQLFTLGRHLRIDANDASKSMTPTAGSSTRKSRSILLNLL